MALRFTPTSAVCVIGAVITGGLLALPPDDSAPSQAPAPPPAEGSTPGAAPVAIAIADFSFGASRTVAAGAVVQVGNADAAAHTLTATEGSFDTGRVDQGASISFTAPAVAGTYDFYCEIHPSMTGSLVVN